MSEEGNAGMNRTIIRALKACTILFFQFESLNSACVISLQFHVVDF